MLTNERTLVIGGGGFIGSELVNTLSESRSVIGTSRSKSGRKNHAGLISFDLFDQSNWKEILNALKPKTVVCTAWETEYKEYWNKDTNTDYSKAILDFAALCFENSVEKFVGLGSMSEYGYSPGACNTRNTPLNPQDLYSETKVLTSIALKELAIEFGKHSLWLRLFQPYGPSENEARLIPSGINTLIEGDRFSLNFPNHTLDFLSVHETAKAIKFALDDEARNEIDIGSGNPISVEQVFRIIGDILNLNGAYINCNERNRSHERLIYVDPASEIFIRGWSPITTLNEGLENYINWTLERNRIKIARDIKKPIESEVKPQFKDYNP